MKIKPISICLYYIRLRCDKKKVAWIFRHKIGGSAYPVAARHAVGGSASPCGGRKYGMYLHFKKSENR
jgi:hypothetical protein